MGADPRLSTHNMIHRVDMVVGRWKIWIEAGSSGNMIPFLRRNAWGIRSMERRMPTRCRERGHDLVVGWRPTVVCRSYQTRAVIATT